MSKPLTRAQTISYLHCDSHLCPYCKSESIEAGAKHNHIDEYTIRQLVECLKCGGQWVDEYRLAGVSAADDSSTHADVAGLLTPKSDQNDR